MQGSRQRELGSDFCLDARRRKFKLNVAIDMHRRKVPNRNIWTRHPRRMLNEAGLGASSHLGRGLGDLYGPLFAVGQGSMAFKSPKSLRDFDDYWRQPAKLPCAGPRCSLRCSANLRQ
jgi:hypothetical protein